MKKRGSQDAKVKRQSPVIKRSGDKNYSSKVKNSRQLEALKPDACFPAGYDFYASVLEEAEQIDFATAAGIDGIDGEIAILRMQIRAILQDDPKNIRLLMAVTDMLTKMVKVRYKINQSQKKGLKEGIANIIREIAVPAGIAILKDRTGQG